MIGFVIFVHTVVCIFLMIAILMQSGRGGGLTEKFASAESMFGAKTNVVMVRITAGFATVFLVTCLTLAYVSARKEQSLIPNTVTQPAPAPASTATPSPLPAAPTQTEPSPVSANATL